MQRPEVMRFIQPRTWEEALAERATHPEAVPVAGGTDVMVDINFDRLHPEAVLDLSRVDGLDRLRQGDGQLRIGANVTYSRMIRQLAVSLPALAAASRTVGSPPIRNRGTIGGNLASASPAGDCHPPLLAAGASVEVASIRGVRTLPIDEFFLGPKHNALAPDELIAAILARPAAGPAVFAKVGPRNAMVIAVCSLSLALHPDERRIGTGIGSAGPTPLRAIEAERFLAEELDVTGAWQAKEPLRPDALDTFADLVAQAARPIDDIRGSAGYRRHALRVLARRALTWCWDDFREQP